ncbi:MAG: WXG100 family type VII secretion target [Nocardioides sp.]
MTSEQEASVDELGPAWLAGVPAMFGSAALSIERHRLRLVGDPRALASTADHWRVVATEVDRQWTEARAVVNRELADWEGQAAEAFRYRLMVWEGEISATAQALRFGAGGLDLAAVAVSDAQRRANAVVLDYARRVDLLYRRALAVPARVRAASLARIVPVAVAWGQQTLQLVVREEARLDHVLASMPRRFVVGKSAPWRRGIMQVTDTFVEDSFGTALTLAGVRGRRRAAISLSRDAYGRHTVTLSDDYGLGGKWNAGAKVNFDNLPSGDRAQLQRAYVEAEAGGVATYTLRYHFDSLADAQAFAAEMQPKGPVEQVVAALRDGVGGPLRALATDRAADEGTISFATTARGNADVGVAPAWGAAATSGAERGVSYLWKAGGGHTWLDYVGADAKAGGQIAYLTETLGLAGTAVTRVDYDNAGNPTSYVVQTRVTGDYDYQLGTNNTYVGVQNAGSALPKGLHAKGGAENSTYTVTSYNLDLTDPRNLAAYQQSRLSTTGAEQLAQRIERDGVLTVQRYAVERGSGEFSADVGLGPLNLGIKGGPADVRRDLVEASYARLGSPESRRSGGEILLRPLPRDPLLPGGGLIDVPDGGTGSSPGA